MRRQSAFLLLSLAFGSACSDGGTTAPGPAESPLGLRIELPASAVEGMPFELTVTAFGTDATRPLAGFSGTATLSVSRGGIEPQSVQLSDGEGTVDARIEGTQGEVTLQASLGGLEDTDILQLLGAGDVLEGGPGDPAAAAIPDLDFVPRPGDYSGTHPELPGFPLSFNTLLVMFERNVTVGGANEVLRPLGADIVGGIPGTPGTTSGLLVLRLASTTHEAMESILDDLRRDPRVRSAVQDARLAPDEVSESNGSTPPAWSWDRTPDDHGNWGLELARVPLLWNFNPAVDKLLARGETSRPVTGVLDVGFADRHEDLEYEGNQTPGVEGDHGTHVAGTIGATFDNGKGIDGVNPYRRLVVRADTTPTLAGTIMALDGLLRDGLELRVVNISLGYNWGSYGVDANNNATAQGIANDQGAMTLEVLEELVADGIRLPVVTASAGNDSNDGLGIQVALYGSPFTNAALEHGARNIIVVEAIGRDPGHPGGGARASFSNVGGHLSAPGRNILSTISGSAYGEKSGTSMAAPLVAGLVGYLYTLDPAIPAPTLNSNFVLDLLVGSAVPVFGARNRVDAFAAALRIDEIQRDRTILRRLVDMDDGTPDGNLRVDPDAEDGSDYIETDADGDGGVGDGRVDMSDFRRWRDGVIYLVDPPDLDLDGSEAHPKKDLNANGTVAYADEFLYPFMDLNGDSLFDNSTAFVPSLGRVSDLEVLQEVFDDPHYRDEHLDELLFSADIAVRPAELLEADDVAEIHSSIRPSEEDEPEDDPRFRRVHTGAEEEGEGLWQVYTVPMSEKDYITRVVALDASGDTLHDFEADVPASPGQDSFWDPAPLQCPAGEPETMLIDDVGVGGGEGGSHQATVEKATWGTLAGRVRTESGENELGPGVTMSLVWVDHIAGVPVDSSDLERGVLIRAEVNGSISIAGSDPDDSRVHTHFSTGDECPGCPIPYVAVEDSRRFPEDGSGTFATNGVASYSGRLGEWIELEAELFLNVGQDFDGSSSRSEARLEIERIIEVVDAVTGEPVAIRDFCTASGHTYPE